MRKSRFTEEQMAEVLREADRTRVAETAKKHKVSEPTIYAWRKHFGHMETADVKRLKALELENARRKKLLAEVALDIEVLKEINARSGEPAGSARSGRAGLPALSVAAPGLRAAGPGALHAELRAAHARQERARHGRHEGAVGAVLALWLPAHPRLPEAPGLRTELVAHASAVRQAGLLLPKRRPHRRIASGRPRPFTPFKANTV